jgi:SecD/SecF fusion protein
MSKNNNLGRFLLVIAIVLWALFETYPLTSRDLVEQFTDRATAKDAAFQGIVTRVNALEAQKPGLEFEHLLQAIGTNDITPYFTFVVAKDQPHPTTFILNQLQRDAAGSIKLGIDLQGGTSFTVEMETNALAKPQDAKGAIAQAVDVLRKRVDAFGVAEPVIQPLGNDEILIELPGLSQAVKENAKQQIQKSAFLEFRLVKEDSAEILRSGQPVPPGYVLMKSVETLQPGKDVQAPVYVVKKKAEPGLSGDIITSAVMGRDNMGNPEIEFKLNSDAAQKFGELTKANIGRQLAIVLDGDLYSAPTIQSPIETGSGSITGTYTPEAAEQLANVLQNPLRAPLHIIASQDVDPTMGKDAIHSGIWSSIYALIFVSVFMLCYYWKAGIAANVALVLNVIILMGVMCSVGTTLTLPGIAGVVLTIGMAVDANVLIYERLREELAKGKSLRGAVDAGYARAFGTIFDSHVTTLISSVILIFMGTGEV